MEVIAVLRLLWRRRILVVVGAALALPLAFAATGKQVPPSGVAETRVALDTPKSQLVTDAPKGADSLPWRATLLATLLGAGPTRERMAREVGIDPDQLAVTDLELTFPSVPASLPRAAVQAAAVTTEPYALIVHTDDVLPVVSIVTSAPDRAAAGRLAEAAVHALQSGASPRDTPELQGLRIERVSPIAARRLSGGTGLVKTAGFAIALMALWCAALTLLPAIATALRTVRHANAVGP